MTFNDGEEISTKDATPNRRNTVVVDKLRTSGSNLFNIIKFDQEHDKYESCVSEKTKKEKEAQQMPSSSNNFSTTGSFHPMTSFTAALNQL